MNIMIEKIKATTLKQRVVVGAIALLLIGGGTGLAVHKNNVASAKADKVETKKKVQDKADKEAKVIAENKAKLKLLKEEADKKAKAKAESEAKAKAESEAKAKAESEKAQAEQQAQAQAQQEVQAQAQFEQPAQTEPYAYAQPQPEQNYAPETASTPTAPQADGGGGMGAYNGRTQADRDRDEWNASQGINSDGSPEKPAGGSTPWD
ncbi:hypothetical protein RyT2_07870 [Pseudolactococcus yaeyamensis]